MPNVADTPNVADMFGTTNFAPQARCECGRSLSLLMPCASVDFADTDFTLAIDVLLVLEYQTVGWISLDQLCVVPFFKSCEPWVKLKHFES